MSTIVYSRPGPNVQVYIEGPRQCGKTQRMLDMTAGAVMAGASPTILCSQGSGASRDIRERLTKLLHDLGVESPRAKANSIVIVDERYARGRRGPVFHEVDEYEGETWA